VPSFDEKARHTSSWSAARMFTQNAPVASMRGQLVDPLPGRNPTSGGSSDTDVKDPMATPTGPSSPDPLMITTPVGYVPSVFR
jgi:hypothetical protein